MNMVLWSTGSFRHPDGEVRRCCPRCQCHLRRLGGTVCSQMIEANRGNAIPGCATQCPTLLALVIHECWKHWRRVSSLGCLTCWSGLCVSGRPRGSRGTVLRSTARQPSSSSMTQPRYNTVDVCIRKKAKPMLIMSLPPTDLVSSLKIKTGELVLASIVVRRDHRFLINVISWCCCAEGNAWKEANCRWHRVKLSCTINWLWTARDVFRNSFIKKEDETRDEEQHKYDHGHDMITMNRTRKTANSWMVGI